MFSGPPGEESTTNLLPTGRNLLPVWPGQEKCDTSPESLKPAPEFFRLSSDYLPMFFGYLPIFRRGLGQIITHHLRCQFVASSIARGEIGNKSLTDFPQS